MSVALLAGPPGRPSPPDAITIDADDVRAVDDGARKKIDWIGGVPIFGVTFLSKLSMPPFAAMGLTFAIPLTMFVAVAGFLSNRLRLHLKRFLAFTFAFVVIWLMQLLSRDNFSVMSLLLLAGLHLPYLLFLPQDQDGYDTALRGFRNLARLFGALGVLQYGLQFAVGPALAFPIENFVPKAFVVSGFNMQGSLQYGSEVFRANGVFMLEPSFFSQLMALGILVELLTSKRAWSVLMMGAALLLSYSGTGLVVLAVCSALMILRSGNMRWIIAGALLAASGVAVLTFFADLPYIDVFARRAFEFTSKGSSGFARYVGGFYLFDQFLWNDPVKALFGMGAGTFQVYSDRAFYAAHGTTFFKMVFEFGVLGSAVYFAFLLYCLWASSAPIVLRIALTLIFFLNGIHVPFSHGIALALLLWNAPRNTVLPVRPAAAST